MEDFSQSEIIDAVMHRFVSRYGITDYRTGGFRYYSDLCRVYGDENVSYRMLYVILKREGFPVTGSKNHYTVQDIQHRVWEFSYDFVELEEDGPQLLPPGGGRKGL